MINPDGSLGNRLGSLPTTQAGRPVPPSPAQKSIDREFGKQYAKFIAGGGIRDAQKNIQTLRAVVSRLDAISSLDEKGNPRSDENLTGGYVGAIPGFALPYVNQEAANVRDQIEEVVQRNLRLILGAQFTEAEGRRLIERAYNPRLDEKQNADRLRRLVDAMAAAVKDKLDAATYFEQHGTLGGYKGATSFDVNSLYGAMEASGDASGGDDRPTEEDIQHTMKIHNMTREQVLERLRKTTQPANPPRAR